MKIVMLIYDFFPVVGGAERQAQRLAKALIDKGHEVTVLTRLPKELFNEFEEIDGIKVIRFKVSNKGKLTPLSYLIKSLAYIWRNKKNIDVLHAHSLNTTGFTAALATYLIKLPSISKIAGGGNEIGCEAKRMYLEGGLKKFRILFMNKYLSKYIAISRPIKQDLLDIGVPENKISFLPNGINMINEDKEDKQRKRNKLKLPQNKVIYLFVGRFEPVKGIDILLKAWMNTSTKFKERSQLVFLGQGSFNLEHFSSEQSINVVGKVDNVNEFLIASDYFLLPSRYEGISNALLEAITHKLPVIVSDAGGNKDIVDKNTGFLFEKENDVKLTRILEETLNYDENKLSAMTQNAYFKINENYAMENVCNSYEQLYINLKNSD